MYYYQITDRINQIIQKRIISQEKKKEDEKKEDASSWLYPPRGIVPVLRGTTHAPTNEAATGQFPRVFGAKAGTEIGGSLEKAECSEALPCPD
jgi:hypothetical protein